MEWIELTSDVGNKLLINRESILFFDELFEGGTKIWLIDFDEYLLVQESINEIKSKMSGNY